MDRGARRWKTAIVSAAAAAFAGKLALALATYGTNDVYAWERFARWSAIFGSGLYSADAAFNHPPSMIHVLAAMQWLAKTTGIFFPFWLRLPAILADAGSLWVVWRIFAPRFAEPAVRWSLLLMALSPVSILVSGFHGNTDPVVMFFLLLSVWAAGEDTELRSGAAFGAAMCVKVLPLIVLPVLFFYRREWRRRIVFLCSAVIVMLVCWSPYVFRDPGPIFRQVIGYQSLYGHWGLTWIASHMTFFRDSWHDAFQAYGAYLVLGVIAVSAWLVNRSPDRPSPYAQTGAAFFFFLTVTNGFGVQYLAWLAPWTVGVAIVPVTFFALAAGAFLFLAYNYWCGGLPWFLADSNYVGDFSGHLDYFLMLCWISVAVLAGCAWRKASTPAPRDRILWSAAAVLVIFFPAWRQVTRVDMRRYPAAADHAALTTIRAHEEALLSERFYGMGRYQEAVIAARTGAALDPTRVDVWNRLALACMRLGRWDEANNAAAAAIRIAPDDELANANFNALVGHRYDH
jgi:hypothetical protein